MHFPTALLFLLPLALAAPTSSDQAPLEPRAGAERVYHPIHPPAGRRAHAHLARELAHAENIQTVKRQVKVRRQLDKGLGKRACKAPAGGQAVIAPSSSSSAAAAAETSAMADTASYKAVGGDAVFPVSVKSSWTTIQGRSDALSFDGALKPLAAGKLPPSVSSPDGSQALQASYPAGTVKYSSSTGHGYSFYSEGAHNGVDVTGATEVVLSYSVYFSQGFDFVRGGKLPGLYGGQNAETAKSCSGGRQDERNTCFSARLMWRADGAGEFYNYLPVDRKIPEGYCSTAPKSVCDANYGDSIGRGSFFFPTSKWSTVTQRLRLNSPASASNGEQELYVDGKSVLKLTGLQIRVTDDTKIYGIMAQTFFGGSDASWASPKDQYAWFKDWSLGASY